MCHIQIIGCQHIVDTLVLVTRLPCLASLLGFFLSNCSINETAIHAGARDREPAGCWVLRSTLCVLEQHGLIREDLPLLPKVVDVVQREPRLAVAPKQLSSAIPSQHTNTIKVVSNVGMIKGDADKVLDRLNLDLVVTHIDAVVVDLLAFWYVVELEGTEMCSVFLLQVCAIDTIQEVGTKAGNLHDVTTNLDGGALDVRVLVANLGSDMNVEAHILSEGRSMDKVKITLSVVVVPVLRPGFEVGLSTTTRVVTTGDREDGFAVLLGVSVSRKEINETIVPNSLLWAALKRLRSTKGTHYPGGVEWILEWGFWATSRIHLFLQPSNIVLGQGTAVASLALSRARKRVLVSAFTVLRQVRSMVSPHTELHAGLQTLSVLAAPLVLAKLSGLKVGGGRWGHGCHKEKS